jgi:DNA polymerase
MGVTHLQIAQSEAASRPSVENVRAELGECTRCALSRTRKNIVFGSGSADADLMFVGEAPGAEEDAQGVPFVGRAGQLLTRIIQAIDLERNQVYIANILKCRPPRNRDPLPNEVESCEPFLFRQIEAIRPLIIVALGKYAAQTLLRSKTPISRLRGTFVAFRGIQLMPTFHPSYLLRNPSAKREVWEDMKKVRNELRRLGSSYYR